MVATLELELSRDTVPYNSVALPRLSPGDGDAAAESRNWPPLRWVPPDPAGPRREGLADRADLDGRSRTRVHAAAIEAAFQGQPSVPCG